MMQVYVYLFKKLFSKVSGQFYLASRGVGELLSCTPSPTAVPLVAILMGVMAVRFLPMEIEGPSCILDKHSLSDFLPQYGTGPYIL